MLTVEKRVKIFLESRIKAPTEAGINKAKEKLKACRGDKPRSKAELMVAPERETAGRMAKAWNKPITKAFVIVRLVLFLDEEVNLVEKSNRLVIRKK